MKLLWADDACGDYLWFEQHDVRLHARINQLSAAIQQQPFKGIGKPEPLKHDWSGYWSRRISAEHRSIYKVLAGSIFVAQCRYHC